MGTTCKIRCKHCGAQLDHPAPRGLFGPAPAAHIAYIETEMPMRCPVCHHRLNPSVEEFRTQVEYTYAWGTI